MSSKYYGSRGSGAPSWYLQRVTGVVLFVVAASAPTLLSIGVLIVLAVVLHNSLGLAVGYGIGKACGLDVASRRATKQAVVPASMKSVSPSRTNSAAAAATACY